MHKNITLSADEFELLIKKARLKAQKVRTTSNARFRQCLEWYIGTDNAAENDTNLMQKLDYAISDKKYNRDELNER